MSTTNLLTINSSISADGIREEMFNGRKHLIVPMVALVEGVVNGAKVTVDEIKKSVSLWNGRPIPVEHPMRNNTPISASELEVERTRNIGRVYNTRVEDAKLKMDGYIDIDLAINRGFGNLVEKLRKGEMINLSTGFYPTETAEDGFFKGKPYRNVWTNIRPDHVALLPNEKGACSLDDGCGVPRINSDGNTESSCVKNLTAQLVTLLTSFSRRSNNTMKEYIDKLINNKDTPWEEADRKALESFGEEKLKVLAAKCGCTKGAKEETGENTKPVVNDDKSNTSDIAKAIELAVNNAVKPIADRLDKLERKDHQARTDRIKALVENKNCGMTEDDLKTLSDDALTRLEKTLRINTPGRSLRANFRGRGVSRVVAGESESSEDTYLGPPKILTAFDAS